MAPPDTQTLLALLPPQRPERNISHVASPHSYESIRGQSGHLGILNIRQELRGHRLLVLRHGHRELALLDVVQPPEGDQCELSESRSELYSPQLVHADLVARSLDLGQFPKEGEI